MTIQLIYITCINLGIELENIIQAYYLHPDGQTNKVLSYLIKIRG